MTKEAIVGFLGGFEGGVFALGLHCCKQVFSSCGKQHAGVTLLCSVQASRCNGFSCFRAQAPGIRAVVVTARRLSSCGTQA